MMNAQLSFPSIVRSHCGLIKRKHPYMQQRINGLRYKATGRGSSYGLISCSTAVPPDISILIAFAVKNHHLKEGRLVLEIQNKNSLSGNTVNSVKLFCTPYLKNRISDFCHDVLTTVSFSLFTYVQGAILISFSYV